MDSRIRVLCRDGRNVYYVNLPHRYIERTTLADMEATLALLDSIQPAIDKLRALADELARELPGVTFGYIGNLESGPYRDDRLWMIFLPHPDRVGTAEDSVTLGPTHSLPKLAEGDLSKLADIARKRYHNGSLRVSTAAIR